MRTKENLKEVALFFLLFCLLIFHFYIISPIAAFPHAADDMTWYIPVIRNATFGKSFSETVQILFSTKNGEWSAPVLNIFVFLSIHFFGATNAPMNFFLVSLHYFTTFLIWYFLRINIKVKPVTAFLSSALFLSLFSHAHAYLWPECFQHYAIIVLYILFFIFYLKFSHAFERRFFSYFNYSICLLISIIGTFCKLSIELISCGIFLHILFRYIKNSKLLLKSYITWCPVVIILSSYQIIALGNRASGNILSSYLGFLQLDKYSVPILFVYFLLGLFLIYFLLKNTFSSKSFKKTIILQFSILILLICHHSFGSILELILLFFVLHFFHYIFADKKHLNPKLLFWLCSGVILLSFSETHNATLLLNLFIPATTMFSENLLTERWHLFDESYSSLLLWLPQLLWLTSLLIVIKWAYKNKKYDLAVFIPLLTVVNSYLNVQNGFLPSRYFIYISIIFVGVIGIFFGEVFLNFKSINPKFHTLFLISITLLISIWNIVYIDLFSFQTQYADYFWNYENLRLSKVLSPRFDHVKNFCLKQDVPIFNFRSKFDLTRALPNFDSFDSLDPLRFAVSIDSNSSIPSHSLLHECQTIDRLNTLQIKFVDGTYFINSEIIEPFYKYYYAALERLNANQAKEAAEQLNKAMINPPFLITFLFERYSIDAANCLFPSSDISSSILSSKGNLPSADREMIDYVFVVLLHEFLTMGRFKEVDLTRFSHFVSLGKYKNYQPYFETNESGRKFISSTLNLISKTTFPPQEQCGTSEMIKLFFDAHLKSNLNQKI